MFWEIIGILATLCVVVSYIPQVVKSFRTKKMDDVSLPFLCIVTFGVFLWLLYGTYLGDALFIYANAGILCLSLSLIAMKINYSFRK